MTKRKEYPGFLLYFDKMEGLINELPDEELGAVLRAMYRYARTGEEPEQLPRELRFFWPMLRKMLDDDRTAYEDKCRAGSYSAACQAAKQRGEKAPDRQEFDKRYDAAKAEEAFNRLPYDKQEACLREEAMRKLQNYMRSAHNGQSEDRFR